MRTGDEGVREGEDTQTLSLSSGTHRINSSLVDHVGRFPVVELREPRNLCVSSVSSNRQEECLGFDYY